MFVADGFGFRLQILHFGPSQQQGLASGFGGAAAAVHADVESVFHRRDYLTGKVVVIAQRLDDRPLDHIAGAEGGGGLGNVMQRKLILGHAPMPLEALGRDAGTHGAAKGHPLGQAAVVPVQQGGRVRVEGVNLQETGDGHSGCS